MKICHRMLHMSGQSNTNSNHFQVEVFGKAFCNYVKFWSPSNIFNNESGYCVPVLFSEIKTEKKQFLNCGKITQSTKCDQNKCALT